MLRLALSALLLLSVPSALSAQEAQGDADRATLRRARAVARSQAQAAEQAQQVKRRMRYQAWQKHAAAQQAARAQARQRRHAARQAQAQKHAQAAKPQPSPAAQERMRRAATGNYGPANKGSKAATQRALLRRAGARPGSAASAAHGRRQVRVRRPAMAPMKLGVKKPAIRRPAVRKVQRRRN